MKFEKYPFERLALLLEDIVPNADFSPSSLTIGEPQFDTPQFIQDELKDALQKGHEGLVFTRPYVSYNRNTGFKVKPIVTYDLPVVDVIEGKGATNKNMLGVAVVQYGDTLAYVSTGFTVQQRVEYWDDPTFIGSIIEVAATSLTLGGSLRHARFIRRRFDKNTVNLED
jgi:ATP-dependent DNA ligase